MVNIWKERRKKFKESYAFELSRLFSYPFTLILHRFKAITPNMITFFSLLVGIVAALFLLNENYIVAGIVYWFSWILDLVDGEIARLNGIYAKTGKYTKFGPWIDGVFDRVKEIIILIAISVVLYWNNPSFFVFILAILAVISSLFWRHTALYTKVRFDIDDSKPKDMKPVEVDVALQNLVISVLIIFNQLTVLLGLFAVLFNLAWIKNLVIWSFKYRKL